MSFTDRIDSAALVLGSVGHAWAFALSTKWAARRPPILRGARGHVLVVVVSFLGLAFVQFISLHIGTPGRTGTIAMIFLLLIGVLVLCATEGTQ